MTDPKQPHKSLFLRVERVLTADTLEAVIGV